jgi:molybdate transport system substrate-binding protein
VLGALLGATPVGARADAPIVAVAANATAAAEALVERFREVSGHTVRLSFGASGTLARQILRGAPFELFLSADEARVQRVVEAGFTRDEGAVYARGRLVLWVPRGGRLALQFGTGAELADLAAILGDARVRRVAIANPEHAPYGRAAREALEHAGLGPAMSGRLVLGENVAQAARFAASAAVDAALLPLSLAIREPLSSAGTHALVPAAWHGPLRQRMVLLRRAGEAASTFYAFILGPEGRSLLQAYGYSVP